VEVQSHRLELSAMRKRTRYDREDPQYWLPAIVVARSRHPNNEEEKNVEMSGQTENATSSKLQVECARAI